MIESEVGKLLEKNAIEKCKKGKDQFVSSFFLVPKPDGTKRFILNLKGLNKFIETPHFKMEDLRSAKNLVTSGAFMASLDLKDAYFLVPVHENSRKYLRFIFKGQIYQFTCLPFGLSTSPYIFTKIMKPVMNVLRGRGFLSTIYLDDIFCIDRSFKLCKNNIIESKQFLEELGFILNKDKSSLIPSQRCKFLGFIFDSVRYTIELPDKKKNQIKNLIPKFTVGKSCKIRDFAVLLGVLNSCCPAVAYGFVHCKSLEREKFLALIASDGDYDGNMIIKSKLSKDLNWWKVNSQIGINPMRTAKYALEISADASLTGWGAYCNGRSANGWWNDKERKCHINYLELLGAFLALKCFATNFHDCEILLRLDNTTAIAYVNKAGGIQFPVLTNLAQQIWEWCEIKRIWIRASYIPSKQNIYADAASRISNIDTEWELSDKAFEKIVKKFGSFTIDLFATYSNKKVKKFCSRFPNPGVFRVDAFTVSWRKEYAYAFPPFALILPALKKFITDEAEGVIVVPNWPTQPWFPLFNSLLRGSPIVFNPNKKLLMSPCREITHPLAKTLSLVAGRLSGKHF